MKAALASFWDWIDKRSEEVGILSVSELERRAGVANGTIRSRKSRLKPPTVEMAEGLCRALRVDWIELWTRAGYVDQFSPEVVNPRASDLHGLDAEIYQALQGTSDDFKQATLETIKAWLICEKTKR